jgi:hypothetical protein
MPLFEENGFQFPRLEPREIACKFELAAHFPDVYPNWRGGSRQMITQQEERRNLSAHLLGELSLDEFEDWLVQQSWDMHLDSTVETQRLVGAIELALSEHAKEDISARELHDRLVSLATNIVMSWRLVPEAIIAPSLISRTNSSQLSLPSALRLQPA